MDEFNEGLRSAIKDRLRQSVNRYASTMGIAKAPGWLKGEKREKLYKDVKKHAIENPRETAGYIGGRVAAKPGELVSAVKTRLKPKTDTDRVENVRKQAGSKKTGPRIAKSSKPNKRLTPYQVEQLKNQIAKGTSIDRSTTPYTTWEHK